MECYLEKDTKGKKEVFWSLCGLTTRSGGKKGEVLKAPVEKRDVRERSKKICVF